MIMTVIAVSLIALLVSVAAAAVLGDSHQGARDLTRKQAYEAAKAGIDDYAFHLHSETGYWAKCTKVPTPNAVNQVGSTTNRRPVPGNSGATYAIELIPATGQSTCDPTSVATATASMLETSGAMKGTFRIRSTGFAGNVSVPITATFKPASFLDYVYFTQLETSTRSPMATKRRSKAPTNSARKRSRRAGTRPRSPTPAASTATRSPS